MFLNVTIVHLKYIVFNMLNSVQLPKNQQQKLI